MARRPLVLYVDNEVRTFVSHRLPLAAAAKQCGYEVAVAAPATGHESYLIAAGFQYFDLPLKRSGKNPFAEAQAVASLFNLYRVLRPDIVHLLRVKPSLYGGLAARMAGVPAVIHTLTGLGDAYSEAATSPSLLWRVV